MKRLNIFFITTIVLLCAAATATQALASTSLQTLEGDSIELSSLKGKWVFINYWASWCAPCLDEISELNRFYEEKRAGNVAIFAVNYDAMPLNRQRRLVGRFNIHYPSLKPNSIVHLHLGPISVVPVTYVLNPQGKLSTILYGGQTMESLVEAMA